MSTLDQFESVFRAAAKPRFTLAEIVVDKVMVVTDLRPDEAAAISGEIKQWLQSVVSDIDVDWYTLPGSTWSGIEALMSAVSETKPDLIVTWRNLTLDAERWPHSLGTHLDILTMALPTPILVLPHPTAEGTFAKALTPLRETIVLTNHLPGADSLVSYGARFTQPGGTLVLAHIEDSADFERYIEAIGKIADLDTDIARREISARLLGDPLHYIESCTEVLAQADSGIDLGKIVPAARMGHSLQDVKALIAEYEADLVVVHTHDDGQLAMHGLSYPLAVELRDIPLLML